MKISQKGLDLIKEFEGLRLHPYKDAVGVPTIGYGTTVYPNGTRVNLYDEEITEEEAEEFLRVQVDEIYGYAVNKANTAHTMTQNMFDALVSFTYNLGGGNLRKSTLLKLHNQMNHGLASQEFKKWNKAGGKVLNGLTRRREAEKALYLS